MEGSPFSRELFGFFRDLKRNNNRAWFLANKERYERCVRRPALNFIRDFAPRLRAVSPHLVASARPVGGSLFKIQRDVRFSKDKTPYKTWASCRFYHVRARDAHTPGFYLHLEEGDVHAAAGVWRPPTAALDRIRRAVVARSAAWRSAVRRPALSARGVKQWGERLKRAPSGYRPDHPLIEDLKWKDFILYVDLSDDDPVSPKLMDRFVEACRLLAPFNRFLCRALGLPF